MNTNKIDQEYIVGTYTVTPMNPMGGLNWLFFVELREILTAERYCLGLRSDSSSVR